MKRREDGVALIMVLIVLSTLAVIGTPFVVSMVLRDRASQNFAGEVRTLEAATMARNHAIARLERTSYPREYERERDRLSAERPRTQSQSGRGGSGSSPSLVTPRSIVERRDLGERGRERDRQTSRGRGGIRFDRENEAEENLRELFADASEGPSPREIDRDRELDVRLPDALELPGGDDLITSGGETVRFRDPGGLTASATVIDEEGRIHLDTAPPALLGNLFGVTQLAEPLAAGDTELVVDDTTPFRGDDDPETIDGALVLVHPESGDIEALTYARKRPGRFLDVFRGDFLSLPRVDVLPAGSFVWDLRGWKIAFHRYWSPRYGGFRVNRPTCFASVEAVREIAGWQMASLFAGRIHGLRLGRDALDAAGVSARRIEAIGLDPWLFEEEIGTQAVDAKELATARRVLRRLRVRSSDLRRIEKERGPAVVIELAARLEGAGRKEVDSIVAETLALAANEERGKSAVDPDWLENALERLGRLYEVPGLETVLPGELEALRDGVTVSSRLEAQWGEPQAILSDLEAGDRSHEVRVPRVNDFNPGTVVRLRRLGDSEKGITAAEELNFVIQAGGIGEGGVRLLFSLTASYPAGGATIAALERHPVNVNTASRRVLRAVFTGVRGLSAKDAVSPYEADRLAARVIAARPLDGPTAFRAVLDGARGANEIDDEDVLPLWINSIQPTHASLRVSTTSFVYRTSDVYTIESHGILRSPAGREIASTNLREIVDVSPSGKLSVGLLTQRDFSEGIWFRHPRAERSFPETHERFLARFPGTRSHLVSSRPLPLEILPNLVPGGDLGSLRLRASRLADSRGSNARWFFDEIEHFDDYDEGLELAHGEVWTVSTSLQGGGSGGGTGASGAAGVAAREMPLDAIQAPGGLEFWMRLKTYPPARSEDGHVKIFEAGLDPERNRIQLLYDANGGRILLRIRDGSLRDPSVIESRESGQYLQIEARRPLELHTWYHVRAIWDGVFAGGAQLWIDGVPLGRDNLATELRSPIPATGVVDSISVEDASRFPIEGVVLIGAELFEFQRAGDKTLRIRREPPRQLSILDATSGPGGARGFSPPGDTPRGVPGVGADGALGVLMRGAATGRGSVTTSHEVGARVSLWGYSLELRRKVWDAARRLEVQLPDGSGPENGAAQGGGRSGRTTAGAMVWGRGGLSLAEPFRAFEFPPGTNLVHYVDLSVLTEEEENGAGGVPGVPGRPGSTGGRPRERDRQQSSPWLVPMFQKRENAPPACEDPRARRQGGFLYRAKLEEYGLQAIDYFQSQGILVYDDVTRGTIAVRYRKMPLPPDHVSAHRADVCHVPEGMEQTVGLFIEGDWPPSGQVAGLTSLESGSIFDPGERCRVTPVSLLATADVEGLYPPTGVLEIEGSPNPYEKQRGRQDLRGRDLFQDHPDDRVEWIRYAEIDGRLIIGKYWQGHSNNFRSYPSRARSGGNQLDHIAGDGLRLVAELSQGGAGFGDYITITSRRGDKQESRPRRVYKAFEHSDGRFFASLVDVNDRGQSVSGGRGLYENDYYRSDDPRLVKFPSWGLPEVSGGGTLTLFGDASIESPASGAAAAIRERAIRRHRAGVAKEDDDALSAIVVDEIRRFRTPEEYLPDARFGPRVRYVVVPLADGRVEHDPDGGIRGRIGQNESISPSAPREVFVVAVSTERGVGPGSLFGQGLERGVLRIGDELFFFEDPSPEAAPAVANLVQTAGGEYDPRLAGEEERGTVPGATARDDGRGGGVGESFATSGGSAGSFENEGFVRIEDGNPERAFFFETVYYREHTGNRFSELLRGRFHTPMLRLNAAADFSSRVVNVTKRLRLVGRALLGTGPAVHELGDAVTLVPWVSASLVAGPLTKSGLPVGDALEFAEQGGYVLIDPMVAGRPWEIVPYLGREGANLLRSPRDERGELCLRGSFGTPRAPIGQGMIAWDFPFRYYDRYEPRTESESLAYHQKSFRIPRAHWLSIDWRERPWRSGRERLCDVIVVARFDGEADWSEEPTNEPGGLYLFEKKSRARGETGEPLILDRVADELEVRIYFRYRPGAFQRLGGDLWNNDWKETPILDELTVEYEKDGAILRHEELPF